MKTALKLFGVAAVAATLFAFKKKNDFEKVIAAMKMTISNPRNFSVKTVLVQNEVELKAYLDFDLTFHNPTDADFDIYTAGLISLKKVTLFHKNLLIGNAFSNTTKFELPAKSNFTISGIKVELMVLNTINQFLEHGMDGNIDNYKIQIEVEALGMTFLIDQ